MKAYEAYLERRTARHGTPLSRARVEPTIPATQPCARSAAAGRVADERGRPLRGPASRAWLRRRRAGRARAARVSVALVSDRARPRAEPHATARNDYATDVLSFPGEPRRGPHADSDRGSPASCALSWATSSSRAASPGARRATAGHAERDRAARAGAARPAAPARLRSRARRRRGWRASSAGCAARAACAKA